MSDPGTTVRPAPGGLRRLVSGALALLVAAIAVPASAQAPSGPELQTLIVRIERLQRELTTLQRHVYRGGAPEAAAGAAGGGPADPAAIGVPGEPNLAAAMQVRLDEIETQMRRFTGRIEELNHAVAQMEKRLDKLVSDIDLRLSTLEARLPAKPGGAEAAGSGPQVTPAPAPPGILGTLSPEDLEREGGAGAEAGAGAPRESESATAEGTETAARTALPEGPPESQYKHATGLLFQSDYAAAERALKAFLERHPEHELAGNAQYWLGETFYVRGDYGNAARAFAEGYQKFPEGTKGPDNLLKLGMSLAALDKTESACATFARLLKDFPEASGRIKAQTREQQKKLGCG